MLPLYEFDTETWVGKAYQYLSVSVWASCEADQGHTTTLGPVSCMPNACSADSHDTGRMVPQATDERLQQSCA